MDIDATARWYDARAPRLGADFLAAVQDVIEQLGEFPESGPLVYRTLRHLLLDRFSLHTVLRVRLRPRAGYRGDELAS
jgi:plasmid stabilization system protein ParE